MSNWLASLTLLRRYPKYRFFQLQVKQEGHRRYTEKVLEVNLWKELGVDMKALKNRLVRRK